MHRIYSVPFAEIYPHYVTKVERKGRSEGELDVVISWLTGYSPEQVASLIETKATLREFFDGAAINPMATAITGVICGVRIEEIEDPLMKKIRYLDKLVDELSRGRAMEKILRS